MSKIVEMLKEKGIAKRIQRNVDGSVALWGKPVSQEEIDNSVRMILDYEFQKDSGLGDVFAEYAFEVAMDSVVKELGIKYNPDSDAARNMSDTDKLRHMAAVRLAKIICPF